MDGDWLIAVTAQAPSNIAVIKYWGKRNEELILPLNGSLSVTLHVDDLCATTTVAVSPKFTTDKLWLNGKVIIHHYFLLSHSIFCALCTSRTVAYFGSISLKCPSV